MDELAAVPEGATVLDVRPVRDYLSGHAHGALNVPVSGSSFATKSGFVLDAAERVVFLELEGYVLGGGAERIEPVDLEELDRLLEQGAEVIDVRERDERDTGYIAGSRNIPYRLLAVGGPELPTDRPVVTICESGARAGVAASILAARGIDARPVLDGGITEWAARGGSTVEFRRCGS